MVEIVSGQAKEFRIIAKEAKPFVAEVTEQGSHLARRMVMVHSEQLNFVTLSKGFGFSANGANAILSSKHGLVFDKRNSEHSLESVLSAVPSSFGSARPLLPFEFFAFLALRMPKLSAVRVSLETKGIKRFGLFASFAVFTGWSFVAKQVRRIALHLNLIRSGAMGTAWQGACPLCLNQL